MTHNTPASVKNKVLFILKKRMMTTEEDTVLHKESRPYFQYCISSGLRNSAAFVVDMLNKSGKVDAKLVEVVDNNCIDREVTLYKPTHVIIEAYWVVPEKFEVLNRLHPKVKWIIRNHSELPFLANEGIAMDWTMKYITYPNVMVAPNSKRCYSEFKAIVTAAYGKSVAREKVIYLPNYYKISAPPRSTIKNPDWRKKKDIEVGCFGAVRPLKNHLLQAAAAIKFANANNLKLRFHINVARIENNGNNALKAIRGVFDNLDPKKFELVEHGWLDHQDFLKLVSTMDIGLQVSFTETFNIVSADFVNQRIPIVTSPEVFWLPKMFTASPTDSDAIAERMSRVLTLYKFFHKDQFALRGLENYNDDAQEVWLNTFKPGC